MDDLRALPKPRGPKPRPAGPLASSSVIGAPRRNWTLAIDLHPRIFSPAPTDLIPVPTFYLAQFGYFVTPKHGIAFGIVPGPSSVPHHSTARAFAIFSAAMAARPNLCAGFCPRDNDFALSLQDDGYAGFGRLITEPAATPRGLPSAGRTCGTSPMISTSPRRRRSRKRRCGGSPHSTKSRPSFVAPLARTAAQRTAGRGPHMPG